MAGVDIGGDGSVQWHAWGDNVKAGKEVVKNKGAHGREHQHVDKTDPGGTFKISIEVPTNAGDAGTFLTSFGTACAAAGSAVPGDRLDFELPILSNDVDQIRIRWDSSTTDFSAHPVHGAKAAMKVGGARKKKKNAKKGSKKGSKKKTSTKKKK